MPAETILSHVYQSMFGLADGQAGKKADELARHYGVTKQTVFRNFSANFANFLGYDLLKIRHLGKKFSANFANFRDGVIVYGGETIPVTPDHAIDNLPLTKGMGKAYKEKMDKRKT